jgi:hypothetical protein
LGRSHEQAMEVWSFLGKMPKRWVCGWQRNTILPQCCRMRQMAENATNFVHKLTDSLSVGRDVNKVDIPDRLNIPTMLDDDAALVCQKKFWAAERNLLDSMIWV